MNTGALVIGGVVVGAIVLVERARRAVEARWYRYAKRRLTDRFGYASFAAMADAHAAKVDAAHNWADLSEVWAEWFDVMERDPAAELKRSGGDGYTRLAELDQGSADTLNRAYKAYDAYKEQVATWRASAFFEDLADHKDEVRGLLRGTASVLDDARRVARELPPKTSTLEDVADAAGSGAASVGNALASAYGSLAEGAGKISGAFAKGALGGASEQLIVIGGLALVAVLLLPRVMP